MKVLVVVDYQNDFVDGALGFEQASEIENGIYELCEKTLAENGKICFTRDTHYSDYLSTREGKYLPIEHCLKGSNGWHLYGRLSKYENNYNENICFVDKPTFGSTGVAPAIRAMCGTQPSEIHICGVVTDICVLSNAIMLHSEFLQTEIIMHDSLCKTSTEGGNKPTMALLKGMGYTIV